jgi:peptidoglycan hydrolase-like protein with peptidoglycan-binding domain
MMNFVFEPVKSVDFNITSTLTFGQRNNQVIELQKMLQYEGLFPANITPTNYYGSITARAVLEWQLKHKVASVSELNALQGRSFGPASLKKFKELY